MIVISIPLLVLITNVFGKYKPDGKSMPEMSFVSVRMADIISDTLVGFNRNYYQFHMKIQPMVPEQWSILGSGHWIWEFDRETFCDLADTIAACSYA
jgi:hypothetical protein